MSPYGGWHPEPRAVHRPLIPDWRSNIGSTMQDPRVADSGDGALDERLCTALHPDGPSDIPSSGITACNG